jgi:hypothetical protein
MIGFAFAFSALILIGDAADKRQQAGQCELEARRLYPEFGLVVPKPTEPFTRVEIAAVDYARRCMEVNGYEYDWTLKGCPVTYYPEFIPGCYEKAKPTAE